MADFRREYIKSLLHDFEFSKLLKHLQTPKIDEYLKSRCLSAQMLECYEFTGTFRHTTHDNCIVVPLRNIHGNLFGAWFRSMYSKRFTIELYKSLNADMQKQQKYWICNDFDASKPNIIFESIFDALSFRTMHKTYNCNVSSSLGVVPAAELLNLSNNTILAFDNDTAGINAMLKYYDKYDVLLPDSIRKDYNEMLVHDGTCTFSIYTHVMSYIQLKQRLA